MSRPVGIRAAATLAAVIVVIVGAAVGLRASGSPAGVGPYSGPFDAHAVVAIGERIVVAGASLPESDLAVVGASDDGGVTWDMHSLDSPPITSAAVSGDDIWMASDCIGRKVPCVLRANPDDWIAAGTGLLPVDDLFASPDGSVTVVSHVPYVQPGLRRTLDGGMTWSVVASPCAARGLVPLTYDAAGTAEFVSCGWWSDSQHWVEPGGWELLRGAGVQWVVVASAASQDSAELRTYNPQSFSFADRETGWMILDGHLFGTMDGGRSWSRVTVPGDQVYRSASSIEALGSGRAYAVLRTEGNGSAVVGLGDGGWRLLAEWAWAFP